MVASKTQNKAALITGCSKRIGRKIALKLANSGFDIAIHYNNSKKEAQLLKEQILQLNVACEIFHADLSLNYYEQLIKEVAAKFLNLAVLVNNASIFEETRFLETSVNQFEDHFDINLKAPFFLSQYFAKIQKHGVIINMLDSRVAKSSKQYFSYLLGKKTLADFTKMAAIELGPDIRVNGVAPGKTEFSLGLENKDYYNQLSASLPLKQIADSDQVAHAVQTLIENESLTGQILFIDGGENL